MNKDLARQVWLSGSLGTESFPMGSNSEESRDPSRTGSPEGSKGSGWQFQDGKPASQPTPDLRFESSLEDSEAARPTLRGGAKAASKADSTEPRVKNPRSPPSESSGGSLIGRLKQRADFLRVAGKRKKWAAPGLVLQVAPQPGTTPRRSPPDRPIRVGFTTSKKVGNAVERNRARRRLRAAVDLVFPREAQTGRDYVVIGRAATVTRPFDLLVSDLRAALKRLGARR